MDQIDLSILSLLKNNAKLPNSDIAKKLDMAPSAIWERIKKLEENNIIKKYSTIIDPKIFGFDVLAFVKIKVNSANWSDKFSHKLQCLENVEELHEIIGEDSYLAKVRAKNMDELSDILKSKIGAIKEIQSTQTVIVTKTIKEDH